MKKEESCETVTTLSYAESHGVCHTDTLCVTILKNSPEETVKIFSKNFSRKHKLLSVNKGKDLD